MATSLAKLVEIVILLSLAILLCLVVLTVTVGNAVDLMTVIDEWGDCPPRGSCQADANGDAAFAVELLEIAAARLASPLPGDSPSRAGAR